MKFRITSANGNQELQEYITLLREHHFDILATDPLEIKIDVRTLDDIRRIQEITKAKWGIIMDFHFDNDMPELIIYDGYIE